MHTRYRIAQDMRQGGRSEGREGKGMEGDERIYDSIRIKEWKKE